MKPLLCCTGVALASLLLTSAASAQLRQVLTNPLSSFAVTIDGLFGGGVGGNVICPNPLVEWSDVAPAGFVAPLIPFTLPRRAPLADAEVLTYSAVCPNPVGPDPRARVEFLFARSAVTDSSFLPGETIAEIRFPIVTNGVPEPGHNHAHAEATLRIFGAICPTPFGPIVIDANGDGVADGAPTSFFEVAAQAEGAPITLDGLQVGVGFGLSPLDGTTPHLIVEVSLPLQLDQQFIDASVAVGGPFSTAQDGAVCPTPVVCPNPIVWSATLGRDADAPPVSSFALAVEEDGGAEVDSSAGSVLVNLHSQDNGGLGKAVTVTLPAGTYLAKPVAGTYQAYNAWGGTSGIGCDAEGRCSQGWATTFAYHTPTAGGILTAGWTWESAARALEKTFSVPIILPEETTVSFYIYDTLFSDNTGGVSVQISPADFSGFVRLPVEMAKAGENIELTWQGDDRAWYYVLRSTDLRHWAPAPVTPFGAVSVYRPPRGEDLPMTYTEPLDQERVFFQAFCFPPSPSLPKP